MTKPFQIQVRQILILRRRVSSMRQEEREPAETVSEMAKMIKLPVLPCSNYHLSTYNCCCSQRWPDYRLAMSVNQSVTWLKLRLDLARLVARCVAVTHEGQPQKPDVIKKQHWLYVEE